MRLTYNAQKFMAAIAAIAMFCFGPAMARETVFVKNGDSYVTKDDNVIYRMTESPVQTTEACSSVDGLDVKNGDVTVVNGDLDGLYTYGDVAKFECNKGVKKTYGFIKSGVTLDLTSAKAGRAFPAAVTSIDIAEENKIYVLDEDMKVKKVYEDCPNNKVPGDGIGKDESKCYEKVTIYDVRVACRALQKAGDGKSSVFMQSSFCAAKYSGVTASKDKCYDISGDKLCSYSENGDAPSTSESATCYDGFTKKTSGTFYKSETDSVTAQSNRPYCTNPTSGYFYGNPSERPYTEYYDAGVTLYEDCSYANVNGLTSDKKGVAGKGIVAKQNGETVCYMNQDEDGCYEIGTAFELYGFANVVNNATYGSQVCGTLVDNIVVNTGVLDKDGALNGGNFTPWTPMNVKSGVHVTLNGAGKTISGLYFNNETKNKVGLFGDVLGAVSISNLGIVDSYFKGYFNVGGLVGYNNGGTLTIENSYNSGTVSGSGDYVGGLVGDNDGGSLSIENSYNAGTVSGSVSSICIGGLVGESISGELTITNSYNSGTVSGGDDSYEVGGLVGCNNGGSLSIENSYNAGTVSGSKDNVGGLVGRNGATLTITNCYNSGTVSGSVSSICIGGLVGCNSGENAKLTITNSFFLAAEGVSGEFGGEVKALEEFHNGTVAFLLHNWCEMDGDNCKVGGLNGTIWGQDLAAENSLPDFSGVVGFKYGSITFFNLNDDVADSASIDATAKAPVSITSDIVVTGPITFKRSFVNEGYSTIMLPFKPNFTADDDTIVGVNFCEFAKYANNKIETTPISQKDLKPNTPYLVSAAGATELVFKNGGVFNTQTGDAYDKVTGVYKKSLANGWSIYGTYEYKTWEEGDAGLGRTYGFAANDGVNDPSIVGKFAKIAAGAYIYPMRAYLEYTAPAALARPAANGEIRTVASLPDEIDVVIVDKDEKTGEQTTKVIGTINTRTGEFKFANDRWFDLNGRYLGNKKPTQKGAYYNNGKKVIVK